MTLPQHSKCSIEPEGSLISLPFNFTSSNIASTEVSDTPGQVKLPLEGSTLLATVPAVLESWLFFPVSNERPHAVNPRETISQSQTNRLKVNAITPHSFKIIQSIPLNAA